MLLTVYSMHIHEDGAHYLLKCTYVRMVLTVYSNAHTRGWCSLFTTTHIHEDGANGFFHVEYARVVFTVYSNAHTRGWCSLFTPSTYTRMVLIIY